MAKKQTYRIVNDWDDQLLSVDGEWRADGVDCDFTNKAETEKLLKAQPNASRLTIITVDE